MPTVGGIVVPTGGAATDGRRTLSEVVDELARPINAADATLRATAADAFRSAVRRMNRKGLWPWERLEEEVTLTAGQRYSTISGVVKKPLSMYLLDQAAGDPYRRLAFEEYDRFQERDTLDVQSEPVLYTFLNYFETSQVRWWPTPSASYSARMTYYRATPAPKLETEVIEAPDYVTDVYTVIARAEFMARLTEGRRYLTVQEAEALAAQAFREISAHVNDTGDNVRYAGAYG